MQSNEQNKFEGWAIVDVLGHQRYAGFVTTEAYGAAVLFRIDVPKLDERERVTVRPGYVGDQYLPAGATVKEGAVEGYSKLIGAGSIYAITPCSMEAVLKAVEETQRRPLMVVSLPPNAALPPAADLGGDNDDDLEDDAGDDRERDTRL